MRKNILLYASGSVSCYKACTLISLLKKDGFDVKVIASENALKFVGRASFEGLSRNKLYTDMFDNPEDSVSHITLSQKWADLIIAYPASANCLTSLACGKADSLFGALCLANNYRKPLMVAPAMNSQMFEHPAVGEALAKLEKWGTVVLPCGTGRLACGDSGKGRLIEPEEALDFIRDYVRKTSPEEASGVFCV